MLTTSPQGKGGFTAARTLISVAAWRGGATEGARAPTVLRDPRPRGRKTQRGRPEPGTHSLPTYQEKGRGVPDSLARGDT
jgi:hypothetical protein